MSIPEPKPNGLSSGESIPGLEPVDPSELALGETPVVEEVVYVPATGTGEPPVVEEVTPSRPGFGFGKALLWCLAFLLVQIIPAVIVVALLVLLRASHTNDIVKTIDIVMHESQTTQILLFIGPCSGIAFFLLVAPYAVGRDWKRKLAMQRPYLEHVILTLLLTFPFLTFSIALDFAIQGWFSDSKIPGTKVYYDIVSPMKTWPWWFLVLAMSVGPAINEELWCRGFLGQGLVGRYGMMLGIVFSSLLFGIIHLLPQQVIAGAVMGIILHLVYVASRSILIPMLLHFLHNALLLLADNEDLRLPIATSLQYAYVESTLFMLLTATVMAFAIGWAFWKSRVRIYAPEGWEVHRPHVEMPEEGILPDRAVMGRIPALAILALIVSTTLFAAVWFGI